MTGSRRIRYPHQANPFWWYEHSTGIHICDGRSIALIRWSVLEAALKRRPLHTIESRKSSHNTTKCGARPKSCCA
jgi:hypothetical protein